VWWGGAVGAVHENIWFRILALFFARCLQVCALTGGGGLPNQEDKRSATAALIMWVCRWGPE